jgi:STE24 endopeptidase
MFRLRHTLASIVCLATFGLLALGLAGSPAHAQQAAPEAAASAPKPAAAPGIAPVTDDWRRALPRDPAAASQAYLDRLSPEAQARSDAYFEGGYWLQLANLLVGLGVAWVLLQSRPGQAARRRCAALSPRRWVQVLAYGAFYVFASWALTLPLTIYQDFVREHRFGMATQSFGAWFGEQLITLGVILLLGPLFVLALYAVIRRAPRRWWLGATAVTLAFLVVTVALGPVFIQPLFNTYRPLADTPVKRSILAMAQANGVPVTNVYEFDASRQTTRISANVSGLGGTAAVRLNDNLLRRTSDAEIRAVVGHEIGHYAMNHIVQRVLQFGLVFLAAFAFVAWASNALLRRFGARWQLSSLQDVGSLPLLAALFSLALFVATPVTNTIVRTMEIEADLFGLNLAREPDAMAEALLSLVEYRKADPGPIEEVLFFDHPSTRTRIYNAMRWKAQMQPAP